MNKKQNKPVPQDDVPAWMWCVFAAVVTVSLLFVCASIFPVFVK